MDGALASRRSCRSFRADGLPDADVTAILDAARRAPSAGNAAIVDLLTLSRPEQVAAYWQVTLPAERRGGFRWPGLLRAPLLVVPLVDPEAYVARYSEADKRDSGLGGDVADWPVPYWWVDGGAAVMAMLLAAGARGVGSLFFGQFGHEAALRERFGWPASRRAVGTIAFGYPDGAASVSTSARRGRRRVDEIRHDGGWGVRNEPSPN